MRCGLEARITEIGELASKPCKPASVEACEFCGGEAIGRYYTGGASPNQMILAPMCSECLRKHEEFYLKNRPTMIHGKKLVKGGYPAIGEEEAAWVNEIATFFIGERGSWPCPRCSKPFTRLGEVVKHFVDSHPELTSSKERAYVSGVGEVFKTWQGFFCPVCGLLTSGEDALREHYRIRHGGV